MELEGAKNLQDLIDGAFCDDPLNGTNQNYILSIIQNPAITADFSKYTKALSDALYDGISTEEGIFPTSLQKSLVTLQLCLDYNLYKSLGEDYVNQNRLAVEAVNHENLLNYVNQEVTDTALYHTIGEKGIMSYIYGLYMLDNCPLSEPSVSEPEIIDAILSLQCEDGGYTLSGSEGDTDVTAMTLQALAPAYLLKYEKYIELPGDLYERLRQSVDKSLNFLSLIQESTGDYGSFGTTCSESTSQVILALYALDIPPISDERFIKDENNCLDGLLIYKCNDKGFSHSRGSVSNDMASSQSLQALTAILNSYEYESSETINAENISVSKAPAFPTKIVIPFGVILICLTAGLILFIKKKKIIHLISALALGALIIGIFFALDIKTKESFENEKSSIIFSESTNDTIEINFLISADTINAGDIFPASNLYVAKDSTVFDVLKEVCRIENIQLDYEKNSVYGLAYVKGIDSIYEYENGDLSGWMYRVNGEMPNIGLGYYTLSAGDKVEILYSTNIGRDLND
ncbi:MAG: DUF4430 domain-containing protein [Lachnospiraceae bacterium]|nr:DUF4430 domain-containing protein [Lachnospiraceae bacterium]